MRHRRIQTLPQVFGKIPVFNDDVRLVGQQQAERVQVGRTNRGPIAVYHRHLGMQKAGFVFVNFHASCQQCAIHRPRRVVLHEIFVFAL